MRKALSSFCLFLFLYSFCYGAGRKTLFEIGKQDNSASEFALYPDQYESFLARFGGVKTLYVGYSTAEKHWPYAFPGPLDHWGGGGYWAGYHPRHFPILYFNVEKAKKENGECTFSVFLTGANGRNDTKIRMDINGHRIEKDIKGADGAEALTDGMSGTSQEVSVTFPADWLRKGMNKIQLGTLKGSWIVFDCLRLETPASFHLGKASSSLIRRVEAAPFEYQLKDGKRVQPIWVDMVQQDEPCELTFSLEGEREVVRTIEVGESIQEIYMPAAGNSGKQVLKFSIRKAEELLYEGTVTRSSQPLHTYSDDVDLLMGTGNSRWMFKPGPTLPLSMVQIAPDNQDEIWKAGYEYTVENIMGFNHFSDWTMTGFLMQPTCGELKVNPGREDYPDEGYRSRIDKQSEKAEIGKYSVFMTDTRIRAEITATRHAAMQRYIFPERKDARILVDLFTPNEYPHNLVEARVTKVSDTEIEGHATYYNAFTGYSLQQSYTLHFVLQFSKPFHSIGGWVNNGVQPVNGYIGGWNRNHEFSFQPEIRQNIQEIAGKGDMGVFLNYETEEGEEIVVRSGVSLVDMAGARNNLEQEISKPFGWSFEKVVNNARKIWDDYLGRIEVESNDYLQKKKFYTNLYRALAAKAVWNDVDGRYVDEDEQVRRLEGSEDCIVSGEYWNTFWNNQQLFNLVAPEISDKWARSAIQLYRNSGWFNTDPAGIEHTGVMVAMHVVSQLLSAWQSGIRTFDLNEAYEGLKKMLTTPPQEYPGGGTVGVENLVPYMKYGYIPSGKGLVSNTLEYAYDDWCLGQMARILGKEEDYRFFDKRSDNWSHLFDAETGFIRPKDEYGNWVTPFDPYRTPGFTEGNAFNYTWFVPHNPERLCKLMGKERFIDRLNQAMERSSYANFNAAGDNFSKFPINHGNETSMEVAYLFNWAGAPELTQKWVRAIQEQYYGTTPYDAYPGDEDLGQMSSWFVMSALGMFQMDGGCSLYPMYELGSPRFPKVTIHLDNKYARGKSFIIEAQNASKDYKYIKSAELNGKPVDGFKIPQEEVLKGGVLKIVMGKD